MPLLEDINTYWPIFVTGVAALVWLVRLEGKVGANERGIDRLNDWSHLMEEKHANLDSKIVNQLSEIKQSLARLEGKLGVDSSK